MSAYSERVVRRFHEVEHEVAREAHRRLMQDIPAFLWQGSRFNLLTAPLIYSLLLPLFVLDAWVTLYQWICFPVYGVERVRRRTYLVLDRHKLAYLNGIEKMNCTFCSYANGLFAYVCEVAARTEQYWCPIKHRRAIRAPHSHYHLFFDYGDAEGYRRELVSLRRRLRRTGSRKPRRRDKGTRATRHLALVALSVIAATVVEAGQLSTAPPATTLVGSTFQYQVVDGDSLALLSSRFGVSAEHLVRVNGFGSRTTLHPGDVLTIDTRHIAQLVPTAPLVINLAQRMLFLRGTDRLHAYPIGVGRSHWPTPTGRFSILEKETNPTWDVPEMIQEEMRRLGRPVQTKMLPGPENPLGRHVIRLSFPNVGIHGIAPSSLYRFATRGDIRLSPDHAMDLFERVAVGTQGVSIYEPVLMTVADGRVWLEVHSDVYRRSGSPRLRAELLANMLRVTKLIDMNLIDKAVREHGSVVDVTQGDE